ncbi:response regulator transcription factor [Planococcus halotolerans]|uniref:DNA-binding response regulator n=1 Tax=Planococcus halotolerans TaxID=2233542 RepID=A0A365L6C1_9BACL|nr:response regulator transcription factor [Planococcus halotolerans]QHJ70313.1 response regulator [Planococcus halotolerans]RAZ80958.1 DNA-binding response regulator [Planococcus halotolerans]
MHILVVEDNPSVSSMLELFFSKEGITGEFASDGIEGFNKYQQNDYDLLVLDWMLPGMDGIALCRKIREQGDQVPIIMLTAKDSESDQVIGFEMGADDYVTKPFSPLTLMARIKAVTRRSQKGETVDDQIQTKHFTINKTTREVQKDGTVIENLTPKEYDLLVFLLQHPKQVFSREQLLERVWGYQFYGDERTVDVHIKRIRKKISGGDQYFHTVWGVGYKFEEQAD